MFKDSYTEFIFVRTYARWLEEQGRRETWNETVCRYGDYFIKRVPSSKKNEFHEATEAIRRFDVMPSMRALWTAGKALDRENVAAFNCAYVAVDSPGCSVRFSTS